MRIRTIRGWFECRLAIWFVGGALTLAPSTLQAQSNPPKEYQIKAAFLLNFAQFVDWPAAVFTNAEAPLTIGVVGDDPFGAALEKTVEGETVHNRRLTIQRSRTIENVKDCHLIFIAKSEEGRVGDILSRVRTQPALTVGEVRGFARLGGVINFYLEGNKVRFEINPIAARENGLKISSQLLRLGRIVEAPPPKEAK